MLQLRQLVASLCYLLCVITCALMTWYSLQVSVETFLRGDHEVRSFDMPRWLIFAIMPLSFGLMSIEFSRYLLGFDRMYDGEVGIKE